MQYHCKNHHDDDHHQDLFPKGKVWMLIVRSVMGASNLVIHFYGVKHMPIGVIIIRLITISILFIPLLIVIDNESPQS